MKVTMINVSLEHKVAIKNAHLATIVAIKNVVYFY